MEPRKRKTTEVATVRLSLLTSQGMRCALCKLPCSPTNAVLDHCHQTGAIRAALHRGCNSVLGKIENAYKRYGVPNLNAFLHGASTYITHHADDRTGLLHPTHRTPDEKRERTNKLARQRRAKLKEAA